jgi:hypothetical protein
MQALWVAVAGPVVSLGLAVALMGLTRQLGSSPWGRISQELMMINWVLGIFNLIPGLPLDGGQVLKACIWQVTGNPFRGVQWAAAFGWVLGILGMVWGTLAFLSGAAGGLWLALIGWFMAGNAQTYRQYSLLQEILLKTRVRDVMSRDFRVLRAELSLRDFVDLYCLPAREPEIYFAEADGRYLGLVDSGRLTQIERSQWPHLSLAAIVTPLDALPSIREHESLAQAIVNLGEDHSWLLVRSPVGGVQGLVLRGNVLKPLAPFLGLTGVDLDRANREGRYPQGLHLVPLAQKALELAAMLPETQT